MAQCEVMGHSTHCQRSTLGKISTLAFLFLHSCHVPRAAFVVTLMKVPHSRVSLCYSVRRLSCVCCYYVITSHLPSDSKVAEVFLGGCVGRPLVNRGAIFFFSYIYFFHDIYVVDVSWGGYRRNSTILFSIRVYTH